MLKPIASLTVLLAASAVAIPSVAQDQSPPPTPARITLKSVSVDLPAGNRVFPGGKEAEAINNSCLTCHSAGMVLNQPALSKATWEAEIRKMISVYKAPVAAEDVPAIVAYLVANRGSQ